MSNHDAARYSQFDEQLAQMEQRLAPRTKPNKKTALASDSSLGIALRIASDLAAGVIVGFAIGYMLDRWTGHKPLFIIMFTMLGMGAGMRNVWRVLSSMDASTVKLEAQKNGRDQRGQRIDD